MILCQNNLESTCQHRSIKNPSPSVINRMFEIPEGGTVLQFLRFSFFFSSIRLSRFVPSNCDDCHITETRRNASRRHSYIGPRTIRNESSGRSRCPFLATGHKTRLIANKLVELLGSKRSPPSANLSWLLIEQYFHIIGATF